MYRKIYSMRADDSHTATVFALSLCIIITTKIAVH